jgi:predicted enzyme related to lactoylglutathione lyase
MATQPTLSDGIALTHFIVAEDVERAARFYSDILGSEIASPASRRSSRSRTAGSSSTSAGDQPTTNRTSFLSRRRILIA